MTPQATSEQIQSWMAQEPNQMELLLSAGRISPSILAISQRSDGAYLWVNAAFEESLGFSAAEVIGKSSLDLGIWVHPEDRTRLIDLLGGESHAVKSIDMEFRHKSGEIRLLRLSIMHTEVAEIPALLFSGVDLTGLRKAERALKAHEALLDTAFHCLPFEFWACDEQGRFLLQSPVITERFGDLTGKTLEDMDFMPEEAKAHWRLNRERAMNGEIVRGRRERTFGPSKGWVYEILAPILQDGKVKGLLGVNIDITDQKEAEDQRDVLRARLAETEKFEALGTLAAGVAHDFNNLLMATMFSCDLLKEGLGDNMEARRHVEEIRSATDHAQELTRQLLVFGRKQALAPKVVDLNENLFQQTRLLSRLVGTNHEVKFLPDFGAPEVCVDPVLLNRSLVNLVVNAKDAMPDGGILTIELGSVVIESGFEPFGHPEVKPGAYAVISVQDQGIGMDQATQKRIFEPFFTTKADKGTGLGLAVVFGFVQESRGYIRVQSQVGYGTTFKLYLPAVAKDQGEAP